MSQHQQQEHQLELRLSPAHASILAAALSAAAATSCGLTIAPFDADLEQPVLLVGGEGGGTTRLEGLPIILRRCESPVVHSCACLVYQRGTHGTYAACNHPCSGCGLRAVPRGRQGASMPHASPCNARRQAER